MIAAKTRSLIAEGGMNHKGARGNVWGERNVCILIGMKVFLLTHQIVHLKWIPFIVGKFYQ